MSYVIQQLSNENSELKDKVKYLEDKIKQLINEKIQERKYWIVSVPDKTKN